MNALIKNNEVIEIYKTPKTITVDGVTYPRGIFKDSEALISFGILPFKEITPNQRYYSFSEFTDEVSNGEAVRTYTPIPRDVEQLKEGMFSMINSQLASKQGQIDWYWQRASKGGKAVPADIQTYSDTLYAEQVTKEAEVDALTTLEDVMLYENTPYTEVRKVKHTSEDGVETYGTETEESNREINMTMHWTANPKDEVDPAFVSLTKD